MNDTLRGCLRMCFLSIVGLALLPVVTVAAESASPATAAEAAKLLNLATLPLVDGAEPPRHRSVAGLSYGAPGTVKQVFDFHRQQLVSQQWKELPGGYLTDQMASATLSRAGYCLSVSMIDYSATLMSVDLPAPATTEQLQYADITAQLSFDTTLPQPEVVRFYRDALAGAGWEGTTTQPIRIGFKDVLIFRNPTKDMLTLEMYTVDGKNRVFLKHQPAAELAELERQVRAEAQRKNNAPRAPSPKLAVALPADAQQVQQTTARIEFKLAAGRAKSLVSAWRKQFAKEGWNEEVAALEEMAGAVSFRKGDQQLSLTYTDTGFLPTEITLQAIGVELGRAAAPAQ